MGFLQDALFYALALYLTFGIVMVIFGGSFVVPSNLNAVIDLVIEVLTGPIMLLKK